MTKEPLSSIDRVWLRMEDPTHPMMITFLLVFDTPIEFERLKAVLGHHLFKFSRFGQRVVRSPEGGSSETWEDDPAFDLDHHLKQTSLPQPGDELALRAAVGELMSKQLDFTKPLWQLHLIASYGSGCALVGRVHHCLADGPALMHVLQSLTDTEPDVPLPATTAQVSPASLKPVHSSAAQLTEMLMEQGINVLFNALRLRSLARLGTGTTTAVSKLLWRSPDPRTIFKGKLGMPKQVAWSTPLPLDEVKAVGRAMGGTVNDVMLATATGALRRYLEGRGEPVQGLAIRAGLSINLRAPDGELWLGNQAGAVLVELPIGLDDALDRLRQVKRSMDEIKNSPEATVVWTLLSALGKAPVEMQHTLVESYCSRETAVIANMPGPAETVYLAGAPLSSLMFWIPALGGVGLCLSIISYAGQVRFGAGTDQNLVPDPEMIMTGFHAEFKAIQHSVSELAPDLDEAVASKGSIETMSAMLDEAIAKVDALLEGQEADPSQSAG